ncbi:MAG: sodium:solute symporter family protein [Sedimentisphaerales bacterium]|nr:sodium:solute symporter family protein [Sedimentisphaerales bacterium]
MFGLSVIDIIVIVAYFAVIVGIGFWSMRRIRNQEDYFLAGRRFGKLIQTFAAFGQATSSDNAVSVTTTTVTNGAAGIWGALNILFATPVYWMTSPWYRRLRLLTMGDFFEDRYGSKKMAGLYALIQAVGFMMMLSLGFSAMSKTVMALTPKSVEQYNAAELAEYNLAQEMDKLESADFAGLSTSEKERLQQLRLEKPRKIFSHFHQGTLMFIVCAIVLIYAVAGGLEAAFLSDMIQGIFIILLSLILLPFAFAKINSIYGSTGVMGAFRTIHERLPESFFEIFGSPASIDFTWYYILTIMFMVTINVAVGANQLSAIGSAKDEYAARFGFTTGLYIKRVCTILWGLLALTAAVLYAENVSDPDMMWGYATLDLLGPLKMGLIGLMIACLMAALMSTADCLMITSSALLTHNLYRVMLPNKTEKHYVAIGRIMGIIVVVGGALIALQFESILSQLKFTWEIGVIFAASFWMGILWRKTNRKAAWASVLVTLLAFFLLPLLIPMIFPGLRTNSYLTKLTEPEPLTRTYTAHEIDVQMREAEIAKWDKLNAEGRAEVARPEPIEVGKKFTKTFQLKSKGIFWAQGVKSNDDGQRVGRDRLYIVLVMLDMLGWDLAKNPNALNETVRTLFQVVTPFVILILLGYLTGPDDKKALDRFYAKMKTPVLVDRQQDRRELELSYAKPHRFDHLKMFPNTSWEFCKWDRTDIVGFSIAMLVAFGIIGLLLMVVSIGG